MTATHLEKIFFHNILGSKDYIHLADPRFFENEIIRECFKVSLEFYNKYTQAPSRQQLEELVKIKGLEEKITNDKLDIIYNVDLTKYDDDWLNENIEAWIEYKNLDASVFDLINYMQTTPATPENIKNIVNTAKSIILERNNLEFNFDRGLDFFNPDSHEQPISDTFTTGYPYLDLVTGGGFSIKTMWVVLGQAKVGKCHTFETEISIRNKSTGEIRRVKVGDFHEETKKNFGTEDHHHKSIPNIAYISKTSNR